VEKGENVIGGRGLNQVRKVNPRTAQKHTLGERMPARGGVVDSGVAIPQERIGNRLLLRLLGRDTGQRSSDRALQRQMTSGEAPMSVPATEGVTPASPIPEGVRPTGASLSFTLPGGTQLRGGWTINVYTSDLTIVTLRISPRGLEVSFTPDLYIDILGPANLTWSGLTYDFASASVTSVSLRDALVPTGGAMQPTARSDIASFLNSVIAATRIAAPGYDPLTDPDVMGTLNSVKDNWTRLPPTGSEVTPRDIRNVELAADITFDSEIRQSTPEGGIFIPAGGRATFSVMFSGSADDVIEASTRSIRWIEIESNSIILQRGGQDVARLQRLYVQHGGTVLVSSFEPLGGLASAAGAESLVRFMGLLIALSSGRPEDRIAIAGRTPNIGAQSVGRIAAEQIQEALGIAIRGWIQENCFVIPETNLCEMLGISR